MHRPTRWRQATTTPREQASQLASRVRRDAQGDPTRFAMLVKRHSDDQDDADGDYGAWSIYDRFSEPQVMQLLRATEVGQVSDVIEDRYHGFRVFRRTPPRVRARYAHSTIVVTAGGGEASRGEAAALARSILHEVVGTPEVLVTESSHACRVARCLPPITFAEGRSDLPDAERLLAETPIGSVVSHIFEVPDGYAIIRRAIPNDDHHPPPIFTLPRPHPRISESVPVLD